MNKIVLDTNIIISAVLTPTGNPAKIIALTRANHKIQLYYNDDILAEYSDVMSRPRLNISAEIQHRIVNAITKSGLQFKPAVSDISLPDESDRIFYDTAKQSGAILITGNLKHYPPEPFVMSPADFLKSLESN